MKNKHHPTESWIFFGASKSEKKELRDAYEELIEKGISHQLIEKVFLLGRQ